MWLGKRGEGANSPPPPNRRQSQRQIRWLRARGGGGGPACDSSVHPRGPRQRRRGGTEPGSAAPEEPSSRGLSLSSLLSLAPSEDFEASSRMPTEHMLRLRRGNILFSSVHQIFMEPRQGHRQAQPLHVSAPSCSSVSLLGRALAGPALSPPLVAHPYKRPLPL